MRVRIKKGETFVGLNMNKWESLSREEKPTLWSVRAKSILIPRCPSTQKEQGRGERILSPHQQSLLGTRHGRLRPSPSPGSRNLHYCSPQSTWMAVILPLTLLPQIQMAWRRFLLAVSIPNENSAPSITSTTIISNSPCLSGSHLIADYRLQH